MDSRYRIKTLNVFIYANAYLRNLLPSFSIMMGLAKDALISLPKGKSLEEIAVVIFHDGKNLSNAKSLHKRLRVWLRILLWCVHHRPSSDSSNYINTDQKYMLYYTSYGIKMNIPSIFFKYMRELVKETINGGTKIRKWFPMGRLISDVLAETLQE